MEVIGTLTPMALAVLSPAAGLHLVRGNCRARSTTSLQGKASTTLSATPLPYPQLA